MNRACLRGLILFCVCVWPAVSAESIGFAYVEGSYRVNGAEVRGNATLFDGTVLETGDSPARLQLNGGCSVWLTPGSRASISARGVVLAKGLGQFAGPAGTGMEAGPVRVVVSAPETVVRVAMEKGGAVVSPSRGAVEVTNVRGVRVGSLSPGTAVRYAEQPVPSAAVQVSGCLHRDGDRYGLTDRVTNVPVWLNSAPLAGDIGRLVRISGVPGTETRGGLQDITVQKIERLAESPCTPALVARAAPAAGFAAREQVTRTAPAGLNLVIVEGEGAINNIRQRVAREPIVQVEDENHRPVAGAAVLFALPRSGASGTFANGATTLQVTTDQQGRAVARGLRPNNQAGRFQIAVTATYGVLTATIAITQMNSFTAVSAGGGAAAGTAAAGGEGTGGGASGGAAAGGASSGGGIGRAATVAIIGGVTATAVVGGLAAGGVIFGGGNAETPASR